MGNSITTAQIRASKSTTTPKTVSLTTFKAGDAIVCPSVGNGTYKLFDDKEYGCLAFIANGETYHYRDDGKVSRDDLLPEIFHNNANPTFIPAASQTTFNIGDVVLCPSLSSSPFVLSNDPRGKRDLLALTHDGSYFYYDKQGYFVPSCDKETGDYQPSLFHDTPANRTAIATLYAVPVTTPIKLIDLTDHDDNEVVLMSSCMLSDTACEVLGATEVMHDIGQLLYLVYNEKISPSQARSMARLVHDTTDRWHSILSDLLETLNKPLEQTAFGKVGG